MQISRKKYRHIGEYIRERRQELGLAQKFLALEIDYSPQYLSNIERGDADPPIKMKKKLLKILRITPAEWIEIETEIFRSGLRDSLHSKKSSTST